MHSVLNAFDNIRRKKTTNKQLNNEKATKRLYFPFRVTRFWKFSPCMESVLTS